MKKINSTLILVLSVNLLYSQNPFVKQWDYRFGGYDNEYLLAFKHTSDGGYILGGWSGSGATGDKTEPNWGGSAISMDYWIFKTDSLGNKQWDKRFGGVDDDELYCLQQTTDGGYILGGCSNSGISGNKTQPCWGGWDYWIVKTDAQGNYLWDKRFGGTDDDQLFSLQQTADGGFILGGQSRSGISGDRTEPCWGLADYWIVKTDSFGNKVWDKRYGTSMGDLFYSLNKTNNGGYILGGYTPAGITGDKTTLSNGGTEYWIIKIDSLGNKIWDKGYGGSINERLYSVQQSSDGGYILGGTSNSDSSGDKSEPNWDTITTSADYWILKTDSLGNKLWDKTYGGTLEEEDIGGIIETGDHGYLMSGTSYSGLNGNKTENNLGTEQAWIVKTDSAGNKLWDKTIFTIAHDESGIGIEVSEGCYCIASYTKADIGGYKTQQPYFYNTDFWMVKLCDSTLATGLNQTQNLNYKFSIYPNPVNTLLTLSVNEKEDVVITNLLGEIVLQKTFSNNTKGRVELDVSFLSSGFYFIKAENEMRKFVKE